MRVLVVHPPVTVARDFIDYPYFADLGAVQVAAVLRAEGHAVRLVDAYALPGATLHARSDGRLHLGAPLAEVLDACADGASPDAIVCAYTPFHRPPERDSLFAALLRGLVALGGDAPVIVADCFQSGQHYVEASGEALCAAYPEAHAWVKYEAEVTLPALLARHARGESIRGAHHGISPADLDALALPAWDLVELGAYAAFQARVVQHLGRADWAFPTDGRTVPMVTSRGCPFGCVHCSSNPGRAEGAPKTQRRLSSARLAEHVDALRARGATRLEILDEMVNVSARHFEGLLDAVERADLRFDVPNGMRADYLSRAHLRRMRGRVTTVSVSAESGVQRVLDEVVGKKLDLREIVRVAEEAHAEGVPLLVHYIIGLPGESAEEINATLEFALDLNDRFGAVPAVQFSTPLPGTGLAKGRTLPVVSDWGPAFQTHPTQPGALVDAATLAKFKWTFDQRLRAASGPEKVILNVTYVCNNHCTFCAVGTRTQVDGHPPSQRAHLEAFRARGVSMVDFDGGEPTLNPELIPLIRAARELGYDRVTVTTNGRLCAYEEYARTLVESGLTTLLFSVHGSDARTHAQQVGVAEAFEQTVQGIEHCVALAPQGVELGMNVTITKGNEHDLDGIAALAVSLGLRWLNLQFLTPFGRATKWVAPDTAAAAQKAIAVIEAYRGVLDVQLINLPFCFAPGYEKHVTGDVGKLRRHMVFVNNEEVNLAAYLAERRVRKPVCAPCPHRVFCGGFYELEDVPEPPWLVREEDLVRPLRRTA